MSKRKKKMGFNAGTVSVFLIVCIFVAVLSIQIYKLKEKDKQLAEREEYYENILSEEEERASEIEELNLHMQTVEFFKEMAHKLGLVLDGEFIFKESDE